MSRKKKRIKIAKRQPKQRKRDSKDDPARSGEADAKSGKVDLLSEPCNVVLTHTNADFDSLAGAVALAKLWSIERPEVPTHVVMPRGVNPLVGRFLAYHKHLLPVRGLKTIREQDIIAVGVVSSVAFEPLCIRQRRLLMIHLPQP